MKKQSQGGFLIAKIHQLSGRIFTRLLKKHEIEINPAQGRIMFVLWRNDKMTIKELARKTSLSKTTLTSMLDRLEAMSYIKRVPSLKDRRKIFIELTEKNRALQEKYVLVSQEMTRIFYQDMTTEEITNFEETLQTLYNNLEKIDKSRKRKQ